MMPRLAWPAAFLTLAASITAFADDSPKPSIVLKPEKVEIKRGDPLHRVDR